MNEKKDKPPDKKSNAWLGPRGLVLKYGRNIHGIVHKKNDIEYKKLKINCYRLGLNLNYNGMNEECGWDYIIKWFNLTCDTFFPYAEETNMDPREFTEEQLVQRMKNAQKNLHGIVKHAQVNNQELSEELVSKVTP